MNEKLVLIGAGSVVFTRGLIADLIHRGGEAELALVDIDADALKIVTRVAEKMVAERNAPIQIRASVDRRDVLKGATAVICTIGVGGRRAWEQDVFIPRKYGIFMPVGDTVGPGGASRALRMIPAMVDIANDVLELAPDALFFNYGNPMAPVCRAVHKATGAKIVGLCHGVVHVARYLADILSVPISQLQYTAIGYNHLTWFTAIRANGKDAMGTLHTFAEQHLRQAGEVHLKDTRAEKRYPYDPEHNPFSWELFQLFGAFPAVLDRHVTEFFPQFFRTGQYYGRTLGVDAFSFEGTIAEGDQTYAEMRAEALSERNLSSGFFERASGEHEQVLEIIDSIRNERSTIYSTNLPNTGQVPNLPLGVIVESPAVADGVGLRPIAQPSLPAALVGTLTSHYMWVETLVEAALEGNREKLIQSLVIDGALESIEIAAALADDLLAAQSIYLPKFANHIRA